MRGVCAALTCVLLAAAHGPVGAQDRGTRAEVTLVVLGRFPAALADAVERGVRAELQVSVRRLTSASLPARAYYARRRRYRADVLLDELRTLVPGDRATTRILGMTDVDISTTAHGVQDWGVFGLGDIGGTASVISIHRLRRRARGPAHLEFRVVSTAIHEVGHTLGLDHCDELHCVMNDAHGTITTVDTSTGHLGPACRAELDQRAPVR